MPAALIRRYYFEIMNEIKIICLGKLKEKYLRDACDEYIKRLGAFCKIQITELNPCRLTDNPNDSQIEAALADECVRIIEKTDKNSYIISLCIEGNQMTSEELSSKLEKISLEGAGNPVFIIGSSHGLSEEIKSKSKIRLSMSKMTFPHQLARVMLLEQLYRAYMISKGRKYHK